MAQDLLTLMRQSYPKFSKGQKAIADYMLSHYDKAAYMTAAKLGICVGVSESTVVRFASELGFDGYPSLQKELQIMIRNKLTSVQRIEVTREQIGNEDMLTKVLNMDIERIRRTIDEISHEHFHRAVQMLVNAEKIYIIGTRSAAAMASFMAFYFQYIFRNMHHVHANSTSEMFEQIMRIGKNDVLIGISFPRYSTRTVKAFDYAKHQGAQVIAITDSTASPLAQNADALLIARSDMASFVDSLVAPLSVINALIVATGLQKQDEVSANFARLEQIWDEYDVYQKSTDENR